MNQELVQNIMLPKDIDEYLGRNSEVRGNNRILLEGPVDSELDVEFVIDNLHEASDAIHTDFCSEDNIYFTINDGIDIKEMFFDLNSIKHLFALPSGKDIWKSTKLYKDLTKNHNEIYNYKSDKWIDRLNNFLSIKYKDEVLEHELNLKSYEKRLNWIKMALKIFIFINVGCLEQGKTLLYRENVSKDLPCEYLLIRSLRNGELEDDKYYSHQYYDREIVIRLVEENVHVSSDGCSYKCLVPKSILINRKKIGNNMLRAYLKTYNLCGKEYKFKSYATIEKKEGMRYARIGR